MTKIPPGEARAQSTETSATLSPDKEIDLIIKSIGEASKHSRAVLLVLLVSALYILLSAFSGHAIENVELPILKITVSNQLFLSVSPVLILALYLYLHICIGDLRRRLRIFEQLNLPLRFAPFAGMLVFPSIITLGFAGPRGRDLLRRADGEMPELALSSLYVFVVVIFVVWVFAPLILLTLWLRFIGQQQLVSLIPCAAIIAALYGSSGGAARSKLSGIMGAIISVTLLGISIASVPALRTELSLGSAWTIAVAIGQRMRANFLPAFSGLSGILGFILVIPTFLKIFMYPIEEVRVRNYLEELWLSLDSRKRGPIRTVVSRLLYVIAESKSPVLALARALLGLGALVGFLIFLIFH